MAEWSNAAVLKTVDLHGSGGSNPSLSALKLDYQAIAESTPNFTPSFVKLGVFFLSGSIFGSGALWWGYTMVSEVQAHDVLKTAHPNLAPNSTHNG